MRKRRIVAYMLEALSLVGLISFCCYMGLQYSLIFLLFALLGMALIKIQRLEDKVNLFDSEIVKMSSYLNERISKHNTQFRDHVSDSMRCAIKTPPPPLQSEVVRGAGST